MEFLLEDDSLRYLYEAGVELNRIQDIDEFDMLFEADSDAVKEQMKINSDASGKSEGFLKKAINAIKGIIKKVIDSIHSFFSYSIASKENKAAFQKFKNACLADPALKDKKITYLDYRKTMEEYDRAIAEAERLDKELAAEREAEVGAAISRFTELAKGTGKATVISVGLKNIEALMDADQGTAEAIAKAVQQDQRILSEIENSLGKSRAKEFNKRAQIAAGNRIGLRRAIVLLKRRKQLTMQEVMQNTTEELKKEFSSKWSVLHSATIGKGVVNDLMHNKEVQDIVQGKDEVSRNVRDTLVRTGQAFDSAKRQGIVGAIKSNISDKINGVDPNQPQKISKRQMRKMEKEKKKQQDTYDFFTKKTRQQPGVADNVVRKAMR